MAAATLLSMMRGRLLLPTTRNNPTIFDFTKERLPIINNMAAAGCVLCAVLSARRTLVGGSPILYCRWLWREGVGVLVIVRWRILHI
jgi:hypothetical protein